MRGTTRSNVVEFRARRGDPHILRRRDPYIPLRSRPTLLHPVFLLEALLRAIVRAVLRPFFPPKEFFGHAGHVIDGDTLYVRGVKGRVRLWGVDAPELGMKGSRTARWALINIVRGERLRFVKMDTDRYGRTVARCFLDDVRDVSELMIESGAAREYYYYTFGHYRLRRILGRRKAARNAAVRAPW